MSLLVLAALQSPFAPAYTLMALLWALTLLSVEVSTIRGSPSRLAAAGVVQARLSALVPIWVMFRAARSR